jgi:glycosyltransferase involved in cell wall biosynthesis
MAHKLDFLLDCAKKLSETNYHFLFIGSGAEKENLKKKAKNEKILNVNFIDMVSKNEIKEYLSIIDIALINLKKDKLFKTVIPSKIFENAAMQIPILLGVDGESRNIIEKYNAGFFYEPENINDFIKKLNYCLQEENVRMFNEGTLKLAKDFDRGKLAKNMLNILRKL